MTSETTSTDAGTADGGGAIDARVEGVQSQIAALEAALIASRKSRMIILVGLVVVIGIVVVLFYGLAKEVQSDEYLTALNEQAQNYASDNTDNYMRQVKEVTDKVTPVVKEAFLAQAKQDAPKLTDAMNKEREVLMKNVRDRLEKQINDQYAKVLSGYEQILIAEFPKAEDDITRRRIMANFQEAMNRMVKQFYADQFQTELQAMYNTWDEFPIADAADEGDVPLEDQLVGYLLELMTMKASGSGSLLGDDKPAESTPVTSASTATEEKPADNDDAPTSSPEPEGTPKETE